MSVFSWLLLAYLVNVVILFREWPFGSSYMYLFLIDT
jgi:hypothetical protein